MTIITEISAPATEMVFDLEGVVLKAYPDVGGVWTIGVGFTMLSKVFAKYWMETRGHALRRGDTITRAECVKLFPQVFNEEYGAAVTRLIAPDTQNVYDGTGSVAYNAGTGSLRWKWAQDIAAAMKYQNPNARRSFIIDGCRKLLTTAITSGGKVWDGLKRRRAIEALLIRDGVYPSPAGAGFGSSESSTIEEIKAYQNMLAKLGYYGGMIDGSKGPLTSGAVKNFQRDKGLKVDGIVGPATRATLQRAVEEKLQGQVGTGTAGTVTTGGAAVETANHGGAVSLDIILPVLLYGSLAVAAVFIGFAIWQNRGRIFRKRTPA